MLKNPVYKGYIDVPRMGIQQKGSFKAMVEPELFDAVQVILDGRSKKLPIYKKVHPDFPLRGIIKCSCGKIMTSNWSKGGSGNKYGYYRCSECSGMNLKKEEIEPQFTNYLHEIKLKERPSEIIKLAVELNWDERSEDLKKRINKLERQQKMLKAQEDKIIDKNMSGVFSDAVAKRRLSSIEKQLAEISLEVVRYQKPEEDEPELINYSVNLLKNMSEVWPEMNPYQKDKFQKFVFPAGLTYENRTFTTIEKPLPVSLNEQLYPENYTMVTPRGIEPRLQG